MADFFEFTENGIRFKGFNDLRTSLQNAWKSTFGNSINLSPTSPDGHHVDLECKTINSVVEGMEVLATMMNRNQAVGQFLDFLAAFLKLTRNPGESDDSLRKRMDDAETAGLATFDGMVTYLKNTIGSDITVSVNEESFPQDGMDPHSIRVTVPSSNATSDDDISKAIWHSKPAGIPTCGNKSGEAVDKTGTTRVVRFSRPSDVLFDVKINLELYYEESFPSDGVELLKQQILAWASGVSPWSAPAFVPGTDIIPQRFFVPILSVSGIKNAVVSVKLQDDDSWTGDVIPVSSEEIACVNEIEVNILQ